MGERNDWLTCDDDVLLRQCSVDTYRASGPGGQHRNKTDSAVRLRHGPSGVAAIAEESRSQHENKARALKRLRGAIALHVRADFNAAGPPPEIVTRWLTTKESKSFSRKHADYWLVMSILLDAVATAGGEIRAAAERLGLWTAKLSKMLAEEPKAMAVVNEWRRERGLRPLTR